MELPKPDHTLQPVNNKFTGQEDNMLKGISPPAYVNLLFGLVSTLLRLNNTQLIVR